MKVEKSFQCERVLSPLLFLTAQHIQYIGLKSGKRRRDCTRSKIAVGVFHSECPQHLNLRRERGVHAFLLSFLFEDKNDYISSFMHIHSFIVLTIYYLSHLIKTERGGISSTVCR